MTTIDQLEFDEAYGAVWASVDAPMGGMKAARYARIMTTGLRTLKRLPGAK